MVRIRRYGRDFKSFGMYSEDVQRIWGVMSQYFDHYTLTNAYNDWSDYSESMCAGWMGLPVDDKEILEVLTFEDD